MSGRGRSRPPVVRFEYKPSPTHCVAAIKLLLRTNKPVSNEDSPSLTTLDDAKVRSGDDSRAKRKISQ